MKIAIAYENGEIYEHFGHAHTFAIYDYDDNDPNLCTKVLLDVSSLHGHKAMADILKENGVSAVMSGMMGPEAKALLLSYCIVPIAGYCGDADTAADLLMCGQLPISGGQEDGGGCSGGCGGCSGCHHEDGEDCDCGGDCGCGCGE